MEVFKNSLLTTLNSAKDYIQQNMEDGVTCPCCNQFVKLYNRKLYHSIVAALIYFWRLGAANKWVHTDMLLRSETLAIRNSGHGDFAKLAYWGLIKPKPSPADPTKKESGYWMITNLGVRFIKGEETVQETAKIYNGNLVSFTGKPISVSDALGNHFNYSELMGRVADGTPANG